MYKVNSSGRKQTKKLNVSSIPPESSAGLFATKQDAMKVATLKRKLYRNVKIIKVK